MKKTTGILLLALMAFIVFTPQGNKVLGKAAETAFMVGIGKGN